MAVVLLAVFTAGAFILYGGIHTSLWQNQEDQLIRELQGLQENTLIYIRQLLMLNHANNDEESYRQIAGDIAQELKILGNKSLNLLDTSGRYLDGTGPFQE